MPGKVYLELHCLHSCQPFVPMLNPQQCADDTVVKASSADTDSVLLFTKVVSSAFRPPTKKHSAFKICTANGKRSIAAKSSPQHVVLSWTCLMMMIP